MRHGSLFSGIGGFDLAADWMGWDNVFHCEWNKFCQAVLKHHFPNSISYDDITKTDFTIHRGSIDILTGGFPCQPYSTAGKRLGKEDSRHLWPEMLRAIREIQPTWVVGENVRGLLSWNGGLVFDEVQSDLEAEGYEVIPLLLPACGVNAPHRRDRIWFVAYSNGRGYTKRLPIRKEKGFSTFGIISNDGATPNPDNARGNQSLRDNGKWSEEDNKRGGFTQPEFRKDGNYGATADTNSGGLEGAIKVRRNGEYVKREGEPGATADTFSLGCIGFTQKTRPDTSESGGRVLQGFGQHGDKVRGEVERCGETAFDTSDTGLQGCEIRRDIKGGWSKSNQQPSRLLYTNWQNFPTQSPIRRGDDGISDILDADAVLKATGGRKAESNWVKESIKAYGNAVVPQVVYQIFKAIDELNKIT